MQRLALRIYLRLHEPVTLRREEGQTMAKYAVVLAVIVLATVAIFGTLGERIQGALSAGRERAP